MEDELGGAALEFSGPDQLISPTGVGMGSQPTEEAVVLFLLVVWRIASAVPLPALPDPGPVGMGQSLVVMKVGSVVEDFSSGSDALIGARQSLQFSHRELEGEAGILSSFGLQLGPGSPSHGHPTQAQQ